MNFIFLYRLYPKENSKNRPAFYSKELALKSFLAAYDKVVFNKRLIIALDASYLPVSYQAILSNTVYDIQFFGGIGNLKSYQRTIDLLESNMESDFFYISEDDYLYKHDALNEFSQAICNFTHVDYITLYDHPDRYTRSDNQTPFGGDKILVSANYHWRTVESTCMTFGGRLDSLKKDINTHKMPYETNYPHDRKLWHKLQGLGKYRWRFPKHRLIAPMPSLATHLEEKYLAPIVDWEAIADHINGNSST